jgi:outer membrane protein assembly factor BamD
MKAIRLHRIFLFPVLLLLLLSACGRYQKVLKSSDFDYKYKMAVKYYEKKDYIRALPLFEELMTIFRGTARSEDVALYFANCEYEIGDYYLAGFHYKEFVKMFPQSKHAEEAMFKNAYCYYKNSPVSSLDQSNTMVALQEFQLFLNMFPASTRIQECNDIVDRLRLKLETKAFDNAKLYYNMAEYKAAQQSFMNFTKEFPDSKFREEAAFLQVKSAYLLALNSIETKKDERLKTTMDLYLKFIDTFPKSKYLAQAESIYIACNRNVQPKN